VSEREITKFGCKNKENISERQTWYANPTTVRATHDDTNAHAGLIHITRCANHGLCLFLIQGTENHNELNSAPSTTIRQRIFAEPPPKSSAGMAYRACEATRTLHSTHLLQVSLTLNFLELAFMEWPARVWMWSSKDITLETQKNSIRAPFSSFPRSRTSTAKGTTKNCKSICFALPVT